jgi:hypothetical protein
MQPRKSRNSGLKYVLVRCPLAEMLMKKDSKQCLRVVVKPVLFLLQQTTTKDGLKSY